MSNRGQRPDIDREKLDREKLVAAALKLLAARSRSEAELRQRLERKQSADEATIDQCIVRLKELGLIDDRRFAESFARSRLNVKAVGRSRLVRLLAARKVGRDVIDSALDTIFETQGEELLIDRAIERHLRLHGRPRDRATAKKLFDHLARRGFEFDLIRTRLSRLTKRSEDDPDL